VSTLAVAPAFYKNPGFDPLTSFVPVGAVSSEATVLVAAPHVKAKTVEEIVAYAKANPGKLNYGAATGTLEDQPKYPGRGLREDEKRWRIGLPGACEHW
jgi:tripartite-type tricarboxylate transporter receptor subunit TctC